MPYCRRRPGKSCAGIARDARPLFAHPRVEALERRDLLSGSGAGAAVADAFPLLTDINQITEGSFPRAGAELGGRVLFAAATGATGRELFSTDGTAAGTRLVADLRPGVDGSDPHDLAVVNGRAVFWAKDAAGVDRLHATDGTAAGTVRLSDVLTAVPAAGTGIVVSAGRAHLFASDGTGGMFVTDGTAAPAPVARAHAGRYPVAFAGAVFYVHEPATGGASLRRIDPDGTVTQVLASGARGPLLPLGDTLLFTGAGEPWRTDGTSEGTSRVAGAGGATFGPVSQAARLDNGTILFRAGTPAYVYALAADGAVTRIWSESYYTANNLTAVGPAGFFTSGNSQDGGTLVATDGTAAGTRTLRGFGTASPGGPRTPGNLTPFGPGLVFAAGDASTGTELWTSDGTADGTRLLADLEPGATGSGPTGHPGASTTDPRPTFFASGGQLYFAATTSPRGSELWRTDGTTGGMTLVADVNTATADAVPANQWYWSGYHPIPGNGVEVGGLTYFFATDGVHGVEPWVTDGTPAGTRMIADLAPGAATSHPSGLVAYNGSAYFVADYVGPFGWSLGGLWRTDGTAAGTVRVRAASGKDFAISRGNERVLFEFQGKLAFFASPSETSDPIRMTVWLSDGTTAGTYRVATSTADTIPGPPERPTVSEDRLYFTVHGDGLYRHDGTRLAAVDPAAQTRLTADLDGGALVYAAPHASGASPTLWAVDALGNRRQVGPDSMSVYDMARLGRKVYAIASQDGSGGSGATLWETDGTREGTRAVYRFGPFPSTAYQLRAVGDRLWFHVTLEATGTETWTTDGTAAGTRMLADLNPGPAASQGGRDARDNYRDPFWVTGPDGFVYFQATTAAAGTELFRTDGTPAGTVPVADFVPGPGDSVPGPFMTVGGSLYVAVGEPGSGREWRRLATAPPPTPPRVDAATVNGGAPQRSRVTAATVRFDRRMTATADAFEVVRRGGSGPVAVAASSPDGGLTYHLSFAGPDVVGGSVPDGVYDLRVRASATRAGDGRPVAADHVVTFHRLFGDANGSGGVNNADYLLFRNAFGKPSTDPAYNPAFDFDGNGTVNNADYAQFRSRFGTALAY